MSLYPLSVIDRNADVSLQQPRSITIRQVTPDGTDTIVATLEEKDDGTIHVRVGDGTDVTFDLGEVTS